MDLTRNNRELIEIKRVDEVDCSNVEKRNSLKIYENLKNCWMIGRRLQLLGGMFVEDFNDDIYEINDEIIDFSFLDTFMIGND
jgi:hypothetical protein